MLNRKCNGYAVQVSSSTFPLVNANLALLPKQIRESIILLLIICLHSSFHLHLVLSKPGAKHVFHSYEQQQFKRYAEVGADAASCDVGGDAIATAQPLSFLWPSGIVPCPSLKFLLVNTG
jgi:hypothetical protein